jgi:hypothetical protein
MCMAGEPHVDRQTQTKLLNTLDAHVHAVISDRS